MKRSSILSLVISAWMAFSTSAFIYASADSTTPFANGADIGWLSQMEASNYIFYNDSGVQQDCMQILKDKGINSLRFRVWVNPTGGWCGKKDVATMAKRADSMGFRVMIDFHYSDWWADPGKQNKPAAWASDNLSQLLTDIYNHTYDVLDTLKLLGITPEWVQVGNETNNGMLWPTGKASTSMANFASMVTNGYNAVKAIDSSILVIVHISNGYDNSLFRWMFDGLKNNGGKCDVIGMSLYPSYSTTPWKTMNSQCLSNMNDMVTRYNKAVMICETGMTYTAQYECNAFLLDLIAKTKSVTGGLGVFYWEPECYNWQSYNLGAWNTNGRPTLAMDAFLGISHIDTTTKVLITTPLTNKEIQIYPNPFYGGRLHIELPGISGITTISILNVNGQVMKEQMVKNASLLVIDNLKMRAGTYFVQINNEQLKEVRILVIK